MPARAPASMDMLQMVMRSSIDSASMARAAILEHVPGAAGDADLADDGEDQVLRGDARRQLAGDVDRERLRPALQQALRREHMADFGRADAEGEGAECAMRAGVAVAADDRLAGLRDAELRPDDVHDAAAAVLQIEQLDAEFARVDLELPDLLRRRSIAIGTPPNTCSVRVGVE